MRLSLIPLLLLLTGLCESSIPCCVYYFSGLLNDTPAFSPCVKNAPAGISWVSDHASVINGAVSFAYGSSLQCPATNLPISNAPRTAMAWVRCPAAQSSPLGFAYAVSWGQAGTVNSRVGIGVKIAGNALYFVGESNDLSTAVVICDNLWHNVAFSWSGSTLSIYKDGALAATQAKSAFATMNLGVVNLGYNGNLAYKSGESMAVALSDVRIYGSALNSTQITSELQRNFTLLQSIMPGYYYNSSAGSVALCTCGYSCPGQTFFLPTLCPAGSISTLGASVCALCPPGRYASNTCSTSCQQCPGGHYCPAGTSSWAGLNCS